MKQFNHLRKELKIRNNKHSSTVELDNVNVRMPRKSQQTENPYAAPDNKPKLKFKLPDITK